MKSYLFIFLSFAAGLVAEHNAILKGNSISVGSKSSPDVRDAIAVLDIEKIFQKPPPTTTSSRPANSSPKPASPPPKPASPPSKPASPPSKPASPPPKPASPPSKPASPPPKPASPPTANPPPLQVAAGRILNSLPPKGTVGKSTGGQCLKPRLPGNRSPAQACSGLQRKRFIDLEEFPSANISVNVPITENLLKRADQYFWMNEGPQGLYWAADASTLWTDRVCGCSIVYIGSPEGTAGIHIAPSLKKPDGTIDTRITPAEFARAHVRKLVEMARNMSMTNKKAVLLVADPTQLDEAVEAMKQELQRASIPVAVHRYSFTAVCQLPDGAGSSVTSVTGTMPACAVFNGQQYAWPR